MDRRSLLTIIGGSFALPLFSFGCARPLQTSKHLVETPALRDRYLNDMLRQLCTDLGPRPVGSSAFNTSADIVEGELRKALPEVTRDNFTLHNWVVSGNITFSADNKNLNAYPGELSSGTPPEGITGILFQSKTQGYTYDIVRQSDSEMLGRIIVQGKREAFTSLVPSWEEGPYDLPVAIIGASDKTVLEDAMKNGIPVRYIANIEFAPDTPTSNLVGTLPGETEDEVLFIAHLDTVYAGHGANDNTASLIGIIMLAHALSGSRPHHTLRFIATAGHELGFLGSKHYMERRRSEGTINRIKYVFDFDSVTWGPNILIMTKDETVRNAFGRIDEDMNFDGTPNLVDSNGAVLDNQPFGKTRVSCIYVGSNGYDHFEKVHHTLFDTPESVPHDCVENAFNLFTEYLRRTEGIAMADITT